jgi:hypothetical protein
VAGSDTDIERRLRDAGAKFIAAHDETQIAVRQAASVGMPVETIAQVSGLSLQTVQAFLRAGQA